MPRKAKDKNTEIQEKTSVTEKIDSKSDVKRTSTSKKGATKTPSAKKSTTDKKTGTVVSSLTGIPANGAPTSAKKATTKKSTTSKKSSLETEKVNKTTKSKKASTKTTTVKKTTTKKADTKKATPKTTTATKKSTANKKTGTVSTERRGRRSLQGIPSNDAPTTKTATKKKTVKSKKAKTEEILEYYDLPYRYNETTVKILAQTPKKLFIYWDISDDDRKNYVEKFGTEFFNNTVPVLIIHNDSQNYTFEVEINDFANCWYLDINDTKCKYTIELGRRSKHKNYSIPNNYIYVTSSNVIESPNDHILFEKQTNTVYFRNVKTNVTHSKDIANISFIRNMGKIYNIYDTYKNLYKKMYNDEDIINLNNPSSANPTSTFK